jgi:hypothetical protein
MPIRPEMRGFYSSDWAEISRRVRFERAAGVCQGCGRPHGITVRCLPDGRWYDATRRTWRNAHGRAARWPDLVEVAQIRHTRVVLAAAHLDHEPRNNRLRNLKSLCQLDYARVSTYGQTLDSCSEPQSSAGRIAINGRLCPRSLQRT